jgi:bacteriocin-like protein
MSDQEKKQEPTSITPQPDAQNKKQSTELSEEELKKVTGGDVASPKLY